MININKVVLYTKENCSFCELAKRTLKENNISFDEKKLNVDFTRELVVETFPSMKTYPIVIVDDVLIGGATELVEYIKINSDTRSLLTE